MLKRIILKLRTIRADFFHRKYLKEFQQKELKQIFRMICQMNDNDPNMCFPDLLTCEYPPLILHIQTPSEVDPKSRTVSLMN